MLGLIPYQRATTVQWNNHRREIVLGMAMVRREVVLTSMWLLRISLYMYLFLLSNVSLGINAPLMAISGAPNYRRVCKKSALLSASANFFRRMCIFFVSCWYVYSYIIQKYA